MTGVKITPFNNSRWKKIFFEKVMLCLNKGNIADSSCSIRCASYSNEIKKVFWMLIFENYLKETKFSVPTSKLKGL